MLMKRLSAACIIVAMPVLFAGCSEPEKIAKHDLIQNQGTTKMARVKTDSGLEYMILQEGTGASVQKGQSVTVHYTGWLNDKDEPGAKFDSSVDRGQPFVFTLGVGYVIKGWDEGVASMKVGEKRRLFVPAALGYGSRGAGRLIPGNAALIFDVELLGIGK